jgi:hypothetical protein
MDPEQLSATKAASPEASGKANSPIDSEQLVPARAASLDGCGTCDLEDVNSEEWNSEGSREPRRGTPKLPREPPKMWEPYLKAFTLFPKLPIEIRQAIWKFTLKPRVIEITHTTERGYYSRGNVPVALRVNKDSRNAVGFLYPLCFGSILHKPRIVFNFSMDTLYFDEEMWTEVPRFVSILKEIELNQIQFIAVDRYIDEVREWDSMGYNPYDNMGCFQTATAYMPALKEFRIVNKIDDMWREHGFPEGFGPVELYEEFPWELQQHSRCDGFDWDGDGDCDCEELPDLSHMLKGIDVPNMVSIWGWRPTKQL